MKKPKLSDYGLKGLDSRPQIDVENHPITEEERAQAMKEMIEWQVGNARAREFRAALSDYEWGNSNR